MEIPIHTTTHKTNATKLALLGALLILAGGVSYFILMDVPWIRSKAIPNTILILIGLFLCTRALIRRRSKLVIAGSAFGYLIATLFFVGTLVLMRLPPPQTAWAVGQTLPEFTLPNQDGKSMSLADYREKGPVLLVFYRGFW